MKKYKIEDIKDWYEKDKNPRYLCIHIETERQHTILKEFMPELTDWVDRFFYYLQSGGYSKNESSYKGNDYVIIKFNDILFKEEEYEIY